MELLDGKLVKKEELLKLKEKLLELKEKLTLVVIQVGNDEASNIYIKQKSKMAEDVGMNFKHIKYDADIKEEELLEEIEKLNNDESVTGIMVQMPISKHLDAKKVQNAIISSKDVDGLTDTNMGMLVHGNKDALIPCTANGIIDILDYYNIDAEGKNVTIIGRSDLVGKPLAALLTNRNATVTLCHSKTKDLKEHTKKADILVVAVGKPKLVDESYVKKGAVVIDVGINRVDGVITGDVDFESVKDKVSYITPVPGGVGPMTVSNLGKNTYKAYTLKR